MFHRKRSNRDIWPCSRFEIGTPAGPGKGESEGNPFHEEKSATIGAQFIPDYLRFRT